MRGRNPQDVHSVRLSELLSVCRDNMLLRKKDYTEVIHCGLFVHRLFVKLPY